MHKYTKVRQTIPSKTKYSFGKLAKVCQGVLKHTNVHRSTLNYINVRQGTFTTFE